MHLHLGQRVAPVRFLAFGLLFAIGLAVLIPSLGRAVGAMAAFDIAAGIFLVSLYPLLDDRAQDMRSRSRANDANRAALLAITGVVTLVVLVAVASEVMGGHPSHGRIALIVATLALAWLFSNTVYALHYAHLYYAEQDGGDAGGLDIPDTKEPGYWDFVYFSFTLGMTFQTSDVEIKAAGIRRVVIGHCLAAFVFNIGVLAFTINVLGN